MTYCKLHKKTVAQQSPRDDIQYSRSSRGNDGGGVQVTAAVAQQSPRDDIQYSYWAQEENVLLAMLADDDLGDSGTFITS